VNENFLYDELTQNKGYYAVQDHSKSPMSVPIKSPYATSYWRLIVTDILSRTVLKLSHIDVYIFYTAFLAPFFGGGGNGVKMG